MASSPIVQWRLHRELPARHEDGRPDFAARRPRGRRPTDADRSRDLTLGRCHADDLNVYVWSRRARERVMEAMRRLYAWLKLRINQAKSAVARAAERKFLGFSLWIAPGRKVKLRVASETWKRVKERVRMLTRRVVGKSMAAVCKELGYWSATRTSVTICSSPSSRRTYGAVPAIRTTSGPCAPPRQAGLTVTSLIAAAPRR